MTKQELINKLAEHSGEPKAAIIRVLDALTDTITETLVAGGDVTLNGIGKLVVSNRRERTVNSPMLGGSRQLPASRTAKLRVSSLLKDAMN